MTDDEQSIIVKAREIIRSKIAIPCTACRYCVDGYPMKIAIPDYFSIYNNLKQFGPKQEIVAHTYYGNLTQTRGKASACIKCGKCESHCPPASSHPGVSGDSGKNAGELMPRRSFVMKKLVVFYSRADENYFGGAYRYIEVGKHNISCLPT